MKTNLKNDKGFTLIELLVVITIIAILATVATPMIGKARVTARMIPATKNVGSIITSMVMYSGEYGGLYPEATGSSNAAFRQLFPDECDSEKIFYIQGDRTFCDPKSAPDEEYGEKDGEDTGQALEAGENHWAYVSGLTDSNKGSTPVVADGFTGDGFAYDDKNHVWAQPNKAIVGFLDGSTVAIKLKNGEIIAPNGGNYFEIEAIKEDENVEVLNPLKRRKPAGGEEA
ncbi:MAG: prepilin-type N-terminal cleavage/methylation domain-containing protein [Verrucomicrobiales bacterium]|jgi:prepilin-type N-terminal cleavage/methylation domain-containing protein